MSWVESVTPRHAERATRRPTTRADRVTIPAYVDDKRLLCLRWTLSRSLLKFSGGHS